MDEMHYNPTPYRGRPTNSHKRGGGGKPPKKGSGRSTFGIELAAGAVFLALPAGVVGGLGAWLAHGYGWF